MFALKLVTKLLNANDVRMKLKSQIKEKEKSMCTCVCRSVRGESVEKEITEMARKPIYCYH